MDEIEQQDVDLNNDEVPELDEQDDAEPEVQPETAKKDKKPFSTEQKLSRGVRMVQKWAKELGIENPLIRTDGAPKPVAKAENKTGELDETQLDYLDLKGITETEDIEVIEKLVQKTGMTVRQALKDDYVQSKLTANKEKREVSAATPSSTKRGNSSGTDSVAVALAKFERDGTLPDDFALRSAVVNAKADKDNPNKPSWH